MEIKDIVKNRVSILDVASLYVNLKPAGKYYKGLCPFHTEKTPSFFINPDKNTFKCYGCNRFGDIFTFIEEKENLSFPEAINFLIERFNLDIEYSKKNKFNKTEEYYLINKEVLNYYRTNLMDTDEGKKAYDYLKQRGIVDATIEEFKLGYSLNNWDGLLNYLRNKNLNTKIAYELGLLKRSKEGRFYDTFRGRIIFPIFSETGKIIGFGGRTIFNENPKYLNSSDNPVFKKGFNLYGFNLTKSYIRETGYAILVEGYMDLITLFQAGIKNVVASLGTGLTENQIHLIKRFSDDILIFYDSDDAGVNATLRAVEIIIQTGSVPFVIINKKTKDPDEFFEKYGLKEFNNLINKKRNGFEFLLNKISKKYNLGVPEQKYKAIEDVIGKIENLENRIIKDEFKNIIADYFKVNPDFVKFNRRKKLDTLSKKTLNPPVYEVIFLESVLNFPDLFEGVIDVLDNTIINQLVIKDIVKLLIKYYNTSSKEFDLNSIYKNLSNSEKKLLSQIYSLSIDEKMKEQYMDNLKESIVRFYELQNREYLQKLNNEIRKAEKNNDKEKLIELLEKKKSLINDKYLLKKRRINSENN